MKLNEIKNLINEDEASKYYRLVSRKAAIEKKALTGKYSKEEIINMLIKIGFGSSKAPAIADKWFEQVEKEQRRKADLAAWKAKINKKYPDNDKGDLADSFVKAWNKKGLGVKAIREETIEEGLFDSFKSYKAEIANKRGYIFVSVFDKNGVVIPLYKSTKGQTKHLPWYNTSLIPEMTKIFFGMNDSSYSADDEKKVERMVKNTSYVFNKGISESEAKQKVEKLLNSKIKWVKKTTLPDGTMCN